MNPITQPLRDAVKKWRKSSNHYSGLSTEEVNLERQAAYETVADELESLIPAIERDIEAGAAMAKLVADTIDDWKKWYDPEFEFLSKPPDSWTADVLRTMIPRIAESVRDLASTDALAQHDEELLRPIRELVNFLAAALQKVHDMNEAGYLS